MLFDLLTYLQPTHYFQMFTKSERSVFPEVAQLPKGVLKELNPDEGYQSQYARDYDLSWQAIQGGYLGDAPTYSHFEKVPLQDNYRFLRKNFHHAWVLYVLILRVLALHNPIKEFSVYWSTKHIKRRAISNSNMFHQAYKSFKSTLIEENPMVSVIIPTLNRYEYLKAVLTDFEQQEYQNFEVIVVDQSEPFQSDFYEAFQLNLKVIQQEEKALWLARNTAIRNAKGTFIALSEDDVRVQPDWLSAHLKCLDYFGAQVSAGVFYPEGQQIPKERSFFTIASQFATGNAMLYKSVFESVGLFDRQFEKQRMGDGEFGMRVYLEDIKSVSNPKASCIDVKAATGGLREMGSWDAFRPSNFFAPRPIPSVIYFFRRYFGKRRTRLALLRIVPISVFPYQYKKNKPLLLLAVLSTILLMPLVLFQVYKSWTLASEKLKQGPLIETLK